MKYNIRGKKIEVTDAIKEYAENKIERLEKYLSNDKETEAKVIISTKGKDQKVEVTIWNGKYNIRAEETHSDLYAALDLVTDKLERQFKKYKDKINDKRRRKNIEDKDELIEDDFNKEVIVRRKEVYLKPIDEEEAITQMELLDHSFFVYKDDKTNKINVIYKRNDGDYGIIEAQ